jgi:cytochrome P450
MLAAIPEDQQSSSDIPRQYLNIAFTALHTTNEILTHTLYHIAANPDYADRLRQEVITATDQLGWTYAALQSLQLMDSIIRETGRYTGIGICKPHRVSVPVIGLSAILRRPSTQGSYLIHFFGRNVYPSRHSSERHILCKS